MAQAETQTDTRTGILTEAERLFRIYGYTKTTVADIAKTCRMSPANVYRFFASKAAINEAICELWLVELETHVAGIARADVSARERLRRLLLEGHRFSQSRFLGESKVHEMVTVAMDEHWAVIQAHLQRITQWIARVIADGIRLGEFRDVDPEHAARLVHSATVSLFHPQLLDERTKKCAELRPEPEELVDFVLEALRP